MSNPSFITKRTNQRKNTSDSNVKHLADHNFYHISNNNNINTIQNTTNVKANECFNSKLSNGVYKESYEPLCNNKINFKINARPYEMAEYLEFKTNYRRGLNSSSNSLISLNESTASPKEDSNFTNQDKELIHSNPDLNDLSCKNYYHNSPKILISPSNSAKSKQRFDNQIEINFNNLIKKEMSNYSNNSNNGSLNLSIHTAEEFSIEMLSWLRNETTTSKSNFINIQQNNLEQIDNATLV